MKNTDVVDLAYWNPFVSEALLGIFVFFSLVACVFISNKTFLKSLRLDIYTSKQHKAQSFQIAILKKKTAKNLL